ncbi:hypothetical protein D3C87_2086670 [compost metagenome]
MVGVCIADQRVTGFLLRHLELAPGFYGLVVRRHEHTAGADRIYIGPEHAAHVNAAKGP